MTHGWPFNPLLLRSHVWLYLSIIVSNSHANISKYLDTVTIFQNLNQATTYYTYIRYIHTTYLFSDHSFFSEQISGETKMGLFEPKLAFKPYLCPVFMKVDLLQVFCFLFGWLGGAIPLTLELKSVLSEVKSTVKCMHGSPIIMMMMMMIKIYPHI